MAEVRIEMTYRLTLTHTEFRLVGLALGGLLKPAQMEEAQALNKKLLEQKRVAVQQHLDLADGALERAENPSS